VVAEKDHLDPARSCMVFFDTSTYVKNGKFASSDPKDAVMIKNWQAQLSLARELKMMIAWPQTAQRPDGAAYFPRRQDIGDDNKPLPIGVRRPISNNLLGAPHIRTLEDIAKGPKDYIFWKERWDPFQGTNFEACLRLLGVDTLIANGGATGVGIASTAYGAHRLDFDLVVVSDGCYPGGSNEEHEVFLKEIFPVMGRVRTADQVMAMLRAGRG
jgi:nicotinamidase-related amidase